MSNWKKFKKWYHSEDSDLFMKGSLGAYAFLTAMYYMGGAEFLLASLGGMAFAGLLLLFLNGLAKWFKN